MVIQSWDAASEGLGYDAAAYYGKLYGEDRFHV